MCRRSIFLLWDILLQILKVVTLDTFERHVIMCCGHVKRRYFSIYSELHSLNKKATKIKEQSIWNILNDYMMYNGFTFEMTLQYNFTSWTYFDTIDSAVQINAMDPVTNSIISTFYSVESFWEGNIIWRFSRTWQAAIWRQQRTESSRESSPKSMDKRQENMN